jgi:fatty acid desaturase
MDRESSQQIATSDDERLARAKRRVGALKGFYIHLAVFVLVMAGLAVINVLRGPPWWVLWVLLGWGIGVVAHGLAVSSRTSRAVADWEERKMREFLREER